VPWNRLKASATRLFVVEHDWSVRHAEGLSMSTSGLKKKKKEHGVELLYAPPRNWNPFRIENASYLFGE